MARGKKTGGKNFEPGQSGNPAGRPPVNPLLREAKNKFKEEFEQIVLDLVALPFDQLEKIIDERNAPTLKMMLSTMMLKGISLGDPGRISFLLDRLVGPVPKAVELSGAGGEPLSPLVNLTSVELTTTLLEIQRAIKEKGCPPNSQQSPALPAPSSSRGSRTGS